MSNQHEYDLREEFKTSSVLALKRWIVELFDRGTVQKIDVKFYNGEWRCIARLTASPQEGES